MAGTYDEKNQKMVCGVCGKEKIAESEEQWEDMHGEWHPYVYDGNLEVSPVCPGHEVEVGDDGVVQIVR